jgi:DNA helicase-2/ATP-dependent DNA helicase PcrA
VANAASLYKASEAGLLEFLEHIELDRSLGESASEEQDTVTLITLHNTKGLEFRRVIMTGIEQGIFPREEKKDEDLEEERRLFYVGATRAMDELYFTSCKFRRMYGRASPMTPSLFLAELDKDILRIVGKAPDGFIRSGASRAKAHSGSYAASSGKLLKSSDGRWTLGDRVFHDDHGYGSVTQILEGEDGPVVKVIFETGYETRFLSLHQSSRFTKIGED